VFVGAHFPLGKGLDCHQSFAGKRSKAQTKSESQIQPTVGGRDRWDVGDRLPVGGGDDILNSGPDPKVVVGIEKIIDVREPVAAPASARRAGIATGRIIRTGWGSFGTRGNLEPFEAMMIRDMAL